MKALRLDLRSGTNLIMKTRAADHHPLASGKQPPGGRMARSARIMSIEELGTKAQTRG